MAKIIGLALLWPLLFVCFIPAYGMAFIWPTAFLFRSDLLNGIAIWSTYAASALTASWLIWRMARGKKPKETTP